MTLAPKHALDGTTRSTPDDKASPGTPAKLFVINLCSVATPITIPQPRAAQLTRFRFFLSHHWENGQRQYRLHMGDFPTVSEAQKWLAILRRIYPTACVSEAPAAQPDLMSSTQALKILEIGSLEGLPHGSGRSAESGAAPREPARAQRAAPLAPSTAERYFQDVGSARPRESRAEPTLEETLNELKVSEFNISNDDDDMNGTGVRHLRVEVEKDGPMARQSKRPGARTRKP